MVKKGVVVILVLCFLMSSSLVAGAAQKTVIEETGGLAQGVFGVGRGVMFGFGEKDETYYWDRNLESAARAACECSLPDDVRPSAPAVSKKPKTRFLETVHKKD